MPAGYPLASLSLVTASIVAATAAQPLAQNADQTRIGAISLSYVARMSRAGKEALTRIDAATRQKSLELDARAAALQRQETELQRDGLGLSERARADLRRAFDKARLEFDRLRQDAQKEIDAMHAQFDVEFRARLAPVIDEIAKEKNLQFVFGLEQAPIAWWSPSVDISAEVVKRLDAGK